MKRVLILLLSVVAMAGVNADQFSKVQTAEIQTIVHDYLVAHPEILIQMSQELQQQQYQKMQQQALAAIQSHSSQLLNPNGTQVLGNPKGAVTVVQFFDYQCTHCETVYKAQTMETLVKANPDLRVVYQDFPIFGPASIYAAKADMAASRQGKLAALRAAIFDAGKIEGSLTTADVDKAAQTAGLNMTEFHSDMNKYSGTTFKKNIDAVYQLAQTLGIQGTPAFVVAPTPGFGNAKAQPSFLPGLVGTADLQQAINQAR